MRKHPFARDIEEGLTFGLDSKGQPCLFLSTSDDRFGAETLRVPVQPFCDFFDGNYLGIEQDGIRISRSSGYAADVTVTSVSQGVTVTRTYDLEIFRRITDAVADAEIGIELFQTLGIQENDRLYDRLDDALEESSRPRRFSRAA